MPSSLGIGGYAMGILAHHAQTYTPVSRMAASLIEGTKSMPVIWLVAIVLSSLAALVIGILSLRTAGVYFIMITLAFGQMFFFFAISWAEYGGEDGLSIYVRNGFPGLEHARSDPVLRSLPGAAAVWCSPLPGASAARPLVWR